MDGLALLCNLYADGPVTLRRLRAAHVHSLDEFERVSPESLSLWLRASVPQATAFAEEARRLARRLSEEAPESHPAAPRSRTGSAGGGVLVPRTSVPTEPSRVLQLSAGLFPGLDEATCTRLHAQGVRTTRALIEFTGLALARRSGIPYSTLLELARRARHLVTAEAPVADTPHVTPRVEPRSESELVPAVPAALAALRAPDPPRTDEFTLPMVEPESAGPFV